jgi:thioredoxin-like negative regulator of GroEL
MLRLATRPAVRAAVLAAALAGLTSLPASAQLPPPPASAAPVWRTDYNTARKEAQEKGLPLLIVVGTENCFYCRKLEANTLRDPRIVGMLGGAFVALKIDANQHPSLTSALKVQVYPTIVMAGPDGKIHAFIEGYVEPDRMAEHMKRTSTLASTPDWAARDYNEATRAIAAGDYPRAVTLLKGIIKDGPERPVAVKSKEALDQIDRQAAGRLARAKELDQQGFTAEAMDALADVCRSYAGTQAADEAAGLMAGLAEKPETVAKQRARRSRDLFAAACEDFRTQRYYDCLQKCEQLSTSYADLPEAKEAAGLAAEIQNNPERLAVACDQMNDKAAAMNLALAEAWMKKGQEKEALACLDKVVKLSPNSPYAVQAQTRMNAIRGGNPAVPTGFNKDP